MRFISYFWKTGVIGSFLTGLFVLLPIILTLLIIEWLIAKLQGALGPGTFFGELMTSGGTALIGPNHSVIAFWLGLAFALLGIWVLGVLVKSRARQQIDNWIDRLFSGLPIVRSIYRPISQVVRLLNSDKRGEFKGMQVVMCRFGGTNGADVLALLTTPQTYTVGGEPRLLVYLPTSPVPMSGGLVFVPEANVEAVQGMDVDDLMKIYFSLGALAPDATRDTDLGAPTLKPNDGRQTDFTQ